MSRGAADSFVITIVGAAFLALLLIAGVGTAQRATRTVRLQQDGMSPQRAAASVATTTRAPVATATRTGTPTPAPTDTRVPSPTATRRPTQTATPAPTETSTETATETPVPLESASTPVPTPAASLHFWLRRPIGPDGTDHVARFYPYASTGEGQYDVHHGVEFVNEEGTPVLATAAGRIVFAGTDDERVLGPTPNFYGQVVVQELDRRWNDAPVYVLYGHLSSISVQEGQRVEGGNQIGLVGTTGIALGPHLHLEVRVGRNRYEDTRNPQLWLTPREGHGVIVGQVLDVQGRPVAETLVSLHPPDSDEVTFYEYTYAQGSINADDEWNENLLIGDVPAGQYRVAARIGDQTRAALVTVRAGEVTFVRLQARVTPPPTATPETAPTNTPAPTEVTTQTPQPTVTNQAN